MAKCGCIFGAVEAKEEGWVEKVGDSMTGRCDCAWRWYSAERKVYSFKRRFFPFGAGSSGVLVYVTVLVTTCLTLTDLCVADLGELMYRVLPSMLQSAGENGENTALLLGESVVGDQAGDCGMRSLRRGVVMERAEGGGRMKGEGGMIGAEDDALTMSWPLHVQLTALEGWVRGVDCPAVESLSKIGLLPVDGVERAGERFLLRLRKSV